MKLLLTLIERPPVVPPEITSFAMSIMGVHLLAGVWWASSMIRRGAVPEPTLCMGLLLGPLSVGLAPIFCSPNPGRGKPEVGAETDASSSLNYAVQSDTFEDGAESPRLAVADRVESRVLLTSIALAVVMSSFLWSTYLRAGLVDSLVANPAWYVRRYSGLVFAPVIAWTALQLLSHLVAKPLNQKRCFTTRSRLERLDIRWAGISTATVSLLGVCCLYFC